MTRRALLYAYPDCTYAEVEPLVEALREARVDLTLATVGNAEVVTSDGRQLKADCELARSPPARLVVVPGGDVYDPLMRQDAVDALVAAANLQRQAVWAGICNGALVLARAGVLRGRQCTHTATELYAKGPDFAELRDLAAKLMADASYVDEDVVADLRVVTAKPWAAQAFARTAMKVAGW